jgi:hypothetical protein
MTNSQKSQSEKLGNKTVIMGVKRSCRSIRWTQAVTGPRTLHVSKTVKTN